MLFTLDHAIESCIFLCHVVQLPRASRYPVMSLFGLVVAFTFIILMSCLWLESSGGVLFAHQSVVAWWG
jgi:hypothetical protein